MLIARKDFPAGTLQEFVAYAKQNHAAMQYGSPGAGSGAHVCTVLLEMAMGVKITHVPYRGAGPAMQDLLAGRIDFMSEQISTAVPQIQAGTVKAIAVLGPERVSVFRTSDRARGRRRRSRLRRLGRARVSQGRVRRDRAPPGAGGKRDARYAGGA